MIICVEGVWNTKKNDVDSKRSCKILYIYLFNVGSMEESIS
jgi:hypothetical protein